MNLASISTENCPVGRTLDIVGTTWTLRVLREAFFGTRRFGEFRERLGVSSALLTERLNLLVEHGILARVAYDHLGSRPRHEYRLTDKGLDLFPLLTALRQWGEQYTLEHDQPPVTVTHDGCGATIGIQLVCTEGHRVTARQARAEPGPGARLLRRSVPPTGPMTSRHGGGSSSTTTSHR